MSSCTNVSAMQVIILSSYGDGDSNDAAAADDDDVDDDVSECVNDSGEKFGSSVGDDDRNGYRRWSSSLLSV